MSSPLDLLNGAERGELRRAPQPNWSAPMLATLTEKRFSNPEIVAFDGAETSFARLQQRMQTKDPRKARNSGVSIYYYVFDLLHLIRERPGAG